MDKLHLRFKERSADSYPSISMRILDPERQRKLKVLKEAGVDISESFRHTAYQAIDQAFEKLPFRNKF